MEINLGYGKRIFTEIVPAITFYQAEEEHQQYAEKNIAKDRVDMCICAYVHRKELSDRVMYISPIEP